MLSISFVFFLYDFKIEAVGLNEQVAEAASTEPLKAWSPLPFFTREQVDEGPRSVSRSVVSKQTARSIVSRTWIGGEAATGFATVVSGCWMMKRMPLAVQPSPKFNLWTYLPQRRRRARRWSRRPKNFKQWSERLWNSTSKSAPTPPVFNDFEFRITVSPECGANFKGLDCNFWCNSRAILSLYILDVPVVCQGCQGGLLRKCWCFTCAAPVTYCI